MIDKPNRKIVKSTLPIHLLQQYSYIVLHIFITHFLLNFLQNFLYIVQTFQLNNNLLPLIPISLFLKLNDLYQTLNNLQTILQLNNIIIQSLNQNFQNVEFP